MTGRAILRLSPIVLLVVVAACGGSGKKTAPSTTSPKVTTNVRVYLLRDGRVQPVQREVLITSFPASEAAYELEGPVKPDERKLGLTTAIEFISSPTIGKMTESPTQLTTDTIGVPSREGIAQIVYTLSSFAGHRALIVNGKRYTRADFEDETPIILVENPLPFAHVTSPIHANGTANTFEATFQYELKDSAGKILAKHFVTATSGTGQRGTFAITIPFTVAHETAGTLVVYEESAANGKRIHQSEIPLTLEP